MHAVYGEARYSTPEGRATSPRRFSESERPWQVLQSWPGSRVAAGTCWSPWSLFWGGHDLALAGLLIRTVPGAPNPH